MYWCKGCGKLGIGAGFTIFLLIFVLAPLFLGLLYINDSYYSTFGLYSTAYGFGMGLFFLIVFASEIHKHPYCKECEMKTVREAEEQKRQISSDDGPIMHPAIANLVILKPNESPLDIWHVRVYFYDKARDEMEATVRASQKSTANALISSAIIDAKYRYESLLIATDHRLIFLKEMPNNQSYHLAMIIEAPKVNGVSPRGNDAIMVAEVDGKGQNILLQEPCTIQRSTMLKMKRIDSTEFSNVLTGIIKRALKQKAEEERKARVHYVLDFSFLKGHMEKGGMVIQQIKCPTCGASINLPSSGNVTTCQYCSSSIYAQDVFDKMKELTSDF